MQVSSIQSLAELLLDPQVVDRVAPEEVPVLLTQLAALQTALVARLLIANKAQVESTEDRLLTIDEAASRLSVSRDFLYRRAKALPFVVRQGRLLRFSSEGLARYIRKRQFH